MITINHASIWSAHEPQIIRLLFPFLCRGAGLSAQRRNGLSVESAYSFIRREVNVPGLVFLDSANAIADQPVFGCKTGDGLSVVAVHALPITSEPIGVVLGLENVKDCF